MPGKYERQDRDDPFVESDDVELSDGTTGTITFDPVERETELFLTYVGVTDAEGSTYEIRLDGRTEYGPDPHPPTDVADSVDVFDPPETYERKVEVIITNNSGGPITYTAQIRGWERRRRVNEFEGVPW